MIGQRIFPDKYGVLRLPEGGYGRDLKGKWHCRPPGGNMGELDHEITEHPDGTITVSPSLDGTDVGQGHWHLIRGVWYGVDEESKRKAESAVVEADKAISKMKGGST